MKARDLRRLFWTGTSVVILLLLVTAGAVSAGNEENSKSVVVQNDAAQPVPIEGDVNITNPSLPVQGTVNTVQSGQWTVGVQGTSDVQPVPSEPVAFTCTSSVEHFGSSDPCFDVPDDRRLFIEQVSAFVSVPTGQNPLVRLQLFRTENSQSVANHFAVPLTLERAGSTEDVYSGLHQVRMYADSSPPEDPGSEIVPLLLRDDDTGKMNVTLGFSGYLVNL